MTSTATASAATVKTYNLLGAIANLAEKTDARGRPYATFELVKASDGKPVKCIVFAAQIDKVKATMSAANDGSVRLFGRYDRRTYEVEGKTKSASTYVALWAGLPKAKDGPQNEADVGF